MRWDKNNVIWTVGIVAGSALGFSLLVQPQMRSLSRVLSDVRAEKSSIAEAGQISAELAELQAAVGRLTESSRNFDKQIPANEMLGAFLEELARSAERQQLKAEQIQPGKPIRSAQVVALPIAFTVRGPFPAVFELIRDLERLDRLTLIDRLEAKTDSGDADTVIAELNVRIYFRAS